jgi:hypothetical protein
MEDRNAAGKAEKKGRAFAARNWASHFSYFANSRQSIIEMAKTTTVPAGLSKSALQ